MDKSMENFTLARYTPSPHSASIALQAEFSFEFRTEVMRFCEISALQFM
jgi:hypothetical protein